MAKVKAKHGFRLTASDIVFNIINYTIFILFALICIFPFYYLFINTISDNALVGAGRIQLLPKGLHFNNYIGLTRINVLGTVYEYVDARSYQQLYGIYNPRYHFAV